MNTSNIHDMNATSRIVGTLDNGMIPRQNGIHLNLDKLVTLGCPVVGGHYHRAQNVAAEQGGQVWYSGSLTRQTFGESEGDKGVLLFEYKNGAWKEPEFISLDPTPMVLIDAIWEGSGFCTDPTPEGTYQIEGARVRFRYRVKQADLATVDLAWVRETFKAAKELKIEQIVELTTAVRSEAMKEAMTVEDCLKVWLESKGLESEQISEIMAEYQAVTELKGDSMVEIPQLSRL